MKFYKLLQWVIYALCCTLLFACGSGGNGGSGGKPFPIAPILLDIEPSSNMTGVTLRPTIRLLFSEEALNVDASTVTLTASNAPNTPIALGAFTAGENFSFTFSPTADLSPLTTYTVTLSSGITDGTGTKDLAPISSSFTTGATPVVLVAPTVSLSMADTSITPLIQIDFSQLVQNVNTSTICLVPAATPTDCSGSNNVPISLIDESTNTFSSYILSLNGQPLSNSTTYYVRFSSGIVNSDDVALSDPLSALTFTTVAASAPPSAPTVSVFLLNSDPAVNGVVTTGFIGGLIFNESIDTTTLANQITITGGGLTNPITPTVSLLDDPTNANDKTIFTIDLGTTALAYSTLYNLNIGGGITSASSGLTVASNTYHFTTEAAPVVPCNNVRTFDSTHQGYSIAISGTVTNQANSVSCATVTLTDAAGHTDTVTTDAAGFYSVESTYLPPVAVTATGGTLGATSVANTDTFYSFAFRTSYPQKVNLNTVSTLVAQVAVGFPGITSVLSRPGLSGNLGSAVSSETNYNNAVKKVSTSFPVFGLPGGASLQPGSQVARFLWWPLDTAQTNTLTNLAKLFSDNKIKNNDPDDPSTGLYTDVLTLGLDLAQLNIIPNEVKVNTFYNTLINLYCVNLTCR